MKSPAGSTFKSFKKDILICLKLTVIFGIFFTIINQKFTLKGAALVFLISAMYSFILGLGNGMINDYLNTKWDWVTETNQRVWAGVISTIVYTVVAVLIIHYIQYIVLFGNNPSGFFKGDIIFVHLFGIIISLGIAAFFSCERIYDKLESFS